MNTFKRKAFLSAVAGMLGSGAFDALNANDEPAQQKPLPKHLSDPSPPVPTYTRRKKEHQRTNRRQQKR